MEINVSVEHGQEALEGIDVEGLARFVLGQMDCPSTTDVSITFVTDEMIHALNRDYRGIDRPTDVLSFECDNDPFDDEDLGQAVEYELGDVIVATDVARAQTAEFGTTLEQEVELLVTHGLLHLCGYDHMEDDEAEVMEALEDKLLAQWRERAVRGGSEDGGVGLNVGDSGPRACVCGQEA